MKFKTLLLRTLALPAVVLTLTCFNSALAQRLNLNFNSAKGYLFRITSKLDEPKTVYCSCDITITKNGTSLILRAADTSFSTQIQSVQKGLRLNTSYLLHILVKQESAGLKSQADRIARILISTLT